MPESLSPVNSIYVRSQQLKLEANDAAEGDEFGHSVSISGNTAIVGVPFNDVGTNADPNANQGSAYIYVRNGETWTLQQQLTPSDGAIGDNFGFSVDIDGDTLVIGANSDDINRLPDCGSAYVFTRVVTPRGSTWKERTKLTSDTDDYPEDTCAGDTFGDSVAIDGNTIIVGASADYCRDRLRIDL